MSLSDDIRAEAKEIFKSAWTTRTGAKVPDDTDLKLTNDGIDLDSVVLYADLAESTNLVKGEIHSFAAEVYKAYLKSACRVIRSNNGVITAFDGDRVMAVFAEGAKNTNAAKTALQITGAVRIVNEELAAYYKSKTYRIKQAVGVDSGKVLVAKTGIRGSNDLVWVGLAANRAAKLSALRDHGNSSWISESVYNGMLDPAKYKGGDPKAENMWASYTWNYDGSNIYGSSWYWLP